jgi:hypothetical protein
MGALVEIRTLVESHEEDPKGAVDWNLVGWAKGTLIEIGCCRFRQTLNVPKSGKPDFGARRAHPGSAVVGTLRFALPTLRRRQRLTPEHDPGQREPVFGQIILPQQARTE